MSVDQDKKTYIIGSGVSGLITALVLEKNGYSPIIIEASDTVGGRLKTDTVAGYELDHGFQVLLTSYPLAKKYLNYETLDLQKFSPGAVIYKHQKAFTIGDGLRKFNLLIPTLFSNIVSLGDKLKILKLNSKLHKKSLDDIFSDKEISTLQYLKDFGFSKKAIENFFIPFFSGIFLETTLETSSRMFEFVYKMFGNGYAALPKGGIGEIGKQLQKQLQTTDFIFNGKVTSIENQRIQLQNGEVLESDMTIMATDPTQLLAVDNTKKIGWKSCQTLYFETSDRKIKQPIIGLIADSSALINNIFYHTSIANENTSKKELLSVTVIKDHNLHEDFLVKTVIKELQDLCGIRNLRFLKMYDITKALPDRKHISYVPLKEDIKINDHLILAGDHLSNGSLNAAMLSGEFAANLAIETLKKQAIS